jgi:AbrB family looped-hinge helix DNA binding protein
MQVTIDQAGRIVIPKAVRDHFGLRKDSTLELEERADGIVLTPVGSSAVLMRDEQGWLTAHSPVLTDVDVEKLIRETRDERFSDLKLEGY